ncbi:MAG: aspartate kinase [Candidatus Kapaibacteriota bacterium]
MGIKVLKFGGTSVANSYAMQKTFDIVTANNKDKTIVVLSACSGITDKLILLSETCLQKDSNEYQKILTEIETHHLKLIFELFWEPEKATSCIKSINFILQSLRQLLEGVRILDELTAKVKAEILSYGEILSTNVFYHYLLFRGVLCFLLDAREIIETDNFHTNAKPNLPKIEQNREKIFKIFRNYNFIITQGFIGSWKKETTLLGRGGSDFSASLFAYSVDADEVQIWTDVDGIMSADPRLVPSAKPIKTITMDEVAELSFFGAKVLHPETVKPAVIKNIPVKVLNTFNIDSHGTTIVANDSLNVSTPTINSMILLEDCYFLKKSLDLNSKNIVYYISLLNDNFDKLLKISFNQNYLYAIATGEKNPSIGESSATEVFSVDRVDVLAFFGNNLSKTDSRMIEMLMKILTKYEHKLFNNFYFTVSDKSILLLAEQGEGKFLLHEFHSTLFEQ